MIRRIISAAIFLSIFPCKGDMIGDFAPIKVGNAWEYSEWDTWNTDFGRPASSTVSMHIFISISKISLRGSDSIVQLSVIQDSSYTFDGTAGGTVHLEWRDTLTYFDTVVTRNDSIIKPSTYRCCIFPFCNTHHLSTDSLQTVFLNSQQSFLFKEQTQNLSYFASYLQNVGLFSKFLSFSSNGNTTLSTTLISFNNININLGTKPFKTLLKSLVQVPSMKKKLIMSNKGFYPKTFLYDLNGRKILASDKFSPGLYFQLQ